MRGSGSEGQLGHLSHIFVPPPTLPQTYPKLRTSRRQYLFRMGSYRSPLYTATKAQHMAHSCQNPYLLPPSYDSCQAACSPIKDDTNTLLGQCSAVDRNIPPLRLPCYMKVPRKSADTWPSSTSANSTTLLSAWVLKLIPMTVKIEPEDARDVNSYQIKAHSSKQGASERLWRRVRAIVLCICSPWVSCVYRLHRLVHRGF